MNFSAFLVWNYSWANPFASCIKGIQDSHGFWIPRRGFRIPVTGFQIFSSGTRIPDSNCQWGSSFLQLYSGFQTQGFRIPLAKIPGFRNPDSLTCIKGCKTVWDSGFRIPVSGFQIFFSGTWIPDCKCQWDSRFLRLYFGFPGTGARIPIAKISWIPESVFPYIGRNPYE